MTIAEIAELEWVRYSGVHRWIRCEDLIDERRSVDAKGGRVFIDPKDYATFRLARLSRAIHFVWVFPHIPLRAASGSGWQPPDTT
jgi:hypothetical protein